MAKQIKKTATKKVVTKKSPVKKTVVKPAPVAEPTCGCGHDCSCGCHKHGSLHFVKHIIVLAIIFVLGMFVGQAMRFGHHPRPFHFQHAQPVFTNGCLDMSNIQCPKMQEHIMKADANGDGCISAEEYKASKPNFKHHKKGPKFPGHKGPQFPNQPK